MNGSLAANRVKLKCALVRAAYLFVVSVLAGLVLGLRPAPHVMADALVWTDLGIVYSTPNSGGTYCPSVVYDANGFESGFTDKHGDQGVVDLGYYHLALPDTLTLAASPSAITANGLSTTTLTATLTEAGSPVPDGTQVVFTSTHGHLTDWDTVYATTTTSGVATATLTSVPSSNDVTATVQATSGGVSDEEAVTFQAITCQSNFTDWAEYSNNPIFDPPGNTIVWSNAAGLYDQD